MGTIVAKAGTSGSWRTRTVVLPRPGARHWDGHCHCLLHGFPRSVHPLPLHGNHCGQGGIYCRCGGDGIHPLVLWGSLSQLCHLHGAVIDCTPCPWKKLQKHSSFSINQLCHLHGAVTVQMPCSKKKTLQSISKILQS